MLLGVISDTHGHLPFTRQAVQVLESLRVDVVIHCGDIGSPAIVPLFARWPTHFVFGNVDHDQPAVRNAILEARQSCHEQFGRLTLANREIAFLHGHDADWLREIVSSQEFDLVCHGHTHVARHERRGRTLVLNPGAVFRANPHSIAVVDLGDMIASIVPVEREFIGMTR